MLVCLLKSFFCRRVKLEKIQKINILISHSLLCEYFFFKLFVTYPFLKLIQASLHVFLCGNLCRCWKSHPPPPRPVASPTKRSIVSSSVLYRKAQSLFYIFKKWDTWVLNKRYWYYEITSNLDIHRHCKYRTIYVLDRNSCRTKVACLD